MQQGRGPDVEVQQGGGTPQFGQAEPDPHEAGLVGEKQGHRVPLLQPGGSLQGSGHLVAPLVHISVRKVPALEAQEDFIGVSLDRVQEAVQDAVETLAFLVLDEPDAESEAPQDVRQVRGKVREKCSDERQGEQSQSGQCGEPHVHFAALPVSWLISVCVYMCACVCMCVCVRGRKPWIFVTKFSSSTRGGAQLRPADPSLIPGLRAAVCSLFTPHFFQCLTGSRVLLCGMSSSTERGHGGQETHTRGHTHPIHTDLHPRHLQVTKLTALGVVFRRTQ